MIAGDDFLRVKKGNGDSVISMLSSSHKKAVVDNRFGLSKIIEVVLLCGQQNVPLRGHVVERSNFIAILHKMAEGDIKLSDWLTSRVGSRYTYLSPDIQNEIINIVGQQVQDSIVNACRQARYFAIIADKFTDKSTKEQLSLCIRFLDKTNNTITVREEFVGFKHAKSVKGAAIADIIVQFLDNINLDIRNLRAQCYDGAANMSGKYNGV